MLLLPPLGQLWRRVRERLGSPHTTALALLTLVARPCLWISVQLVVVKGVAPAVQELLVLGCAYAEV